MRSLSLCTRREHILALVSSFTHIDYPSVCVWYRRSTYPAGCHCINDIVVSEVAEAHERVHVDYEYHENGGHDELPAVVRDRCKYVLQCLGSIYDIQQMERCTANAATESELPPQQQLTTTSNKQQQETSNKQQQAASKQAASKQHSRWCHPVDRPDAVERPLYVELFGGNVIRKRQYERTYRRRMARRPDLRWRTLGRRSSTC
jgi:hypothetical protein